MNTVAVDSFPSLVSMLCFSVKVARVLTCNRYMSVEKIVSSWCLVTALITVLPKGCFAVFPLSLENSKSINTDTVVTIATVY